jgi:hypothetical protein
LRVRKALWDPPGWVAALNSHLSQQTPSSSLVVWPLNPFVAEITALCIAVKQPNSVGWVTHAGWAGPDRRAQETRPGGFGQNLSATDNDTADKLASVSLSGRTGLERQKDPSSRGDVCQSPQVPLT